MLSVSKSAREKDVSVNIDVLVTKKSQVATVHVSFGSGNSSSVILQKLLHNFCKEKTLPALMQQGTFVFDAVAGKNSISFSCADAKVMNALLSLYLHLHKMNLSIPELKQVADKNDNFQSVYRLLASVTVNVVGKAKNTLTAIQSNSKKWQAFMSSMHAVHDKFKDKIKEIKHVATPAAPWEKKYSYNSDPEDDRLFNLYLAIVLGDINCYVSKQQSLGFTLTSIGDEVIWHNVSKAMIKNRIKAFYTQFGALGSEPSDRDAKAKWNEKGRMIMESLNRVARDICELKGLAPYTFKKYSDCNDIDSKTIAIIKSIKLQ